MPNRQPNTIDEIEAAARSSSINKTVKEIDQLLEGERIFSHSPLRAKLHDKIFELLRSETRLWYKRGFRRGHKICRNKQPRTPKRIAVKMRIRAPYLAEKGERVILKSTLKT